MALRIPSSSIRYRKEFNSANKNVDETLENWYDRLKQLAERCEYGSCSEAFILHQFVCGLDVLILELLDAQQKDLSLIDILDLTKNIDRSHEPVDVVSLFLGRPTRFIVLQKFMKIFFFGQISQKPVLLSIKLEELPTSDGEHYVDNSFNDDYSDDEEETNAVRQVTNEEKPEEKLQVNDVAKRDNFLSMAPFMAEAVIEHQSNTTIFECYLCHKTWRTAGTYDLLSIRYEFHDHFPISQVT